MLIESLPKGTCKSGVTIQHNIRWEPREFNDVRMEERGKRGSIDVGGGGDEVTHLG